MNLFNKAINQEPLYDFSYNMAHSGNFSEVYTLQHGTVYNKSVYSIVGKYDKAIKTTIGVNYKNKKEKKIFNIEFPEKNTENEYIKRIWAKARIDYLLELINNKGEKKEWINEIIALSKEFTIVTPYTSFLAAPRSLIRPRSIIPGDPVLRVKTDKNIISVVAKFEFGLTKKLNFIPSKNIWEIRFLAPDYLKYGNYKVDLFLTERDGTSIIETKYITIDSTPPIIKKRYKLDGENLKLIVDASRDTKKIYAYLDDKVFSIKYNKKEGHSIAILPNGRAYKNKKIKYILEDFAHNSSTVYDIINFEE
jgi:Ca-activated chloride channel family protein